MPAYGQGMLLSAAEKQQMSKRWKPSFLLPFISPAKHVLTPGVSHPSFPVLGLVDEQNMAPGGWGGGGILYPPR